VKLNYSPNTSTTTKLILIYTWRTFWHQRIPRKPVPTKNTSRTRQDNTSEGSPINSRVYHIRDTPHDKRSHGGRLTSRARRIYANLNVSTPSPLTHKLLAPSLPHHTHAGTGEPITKQTDTPPAANKPRPLHNSRGQTLGPIQKQKHYRNHPNHPKANGSGPRPTNTTRATTPQTATRTERASQPTHLA